MLGKSSANSEIIIPDQNLYRGHLYLYIDAADTKDLQLDTTYQHEFLLTLSDKSANLSNPAAADSIKVGEIFLRRQYEVQA